jgi:ribosomal protein S18 acetylase RimI-like enzyme
MTKEDAKQIADLINERNQLTKKQQSNDILFNKDSYVFIKDDDKIIACAESKQIQWYQYEICHVSIHKDYEGKRFGTKILKLAENIVKNNNGKIIQCTIRSNNENSIRLFTRKGYNEVNKFFNPKSENWINIYQKIISIE